MELSKHAEYNQLFSVNLKTFIKNIKNSKKSKYTKKRYCLFFPMIGKDYFQTNDLLVIGRAVNRWETKFTSALKELNSDELVDDSIETSSGDNDKCPLEWLWNGWIGKDGKRHKYDFNRSPFWNVINKIIVKKYEKNEMNWTHIIAWSNITKIAPAKGKNPEGFEWDAQYEKSVDLFIAELDLLEPKLVLMITDFFSWGQYFLKRHGFEIDKKYDDEYVEAIVNYKTTKIIVTVRPEGKTQDEFVDNVLKYMK